jgi:limonene-1,2-epoxide hydrolase
MVDKTQPVRNVLKAWNDCDIALLMEQFEDGARFENVPMNPIVGKDAIRASALAFMEQIESAPWELISIQQTPDGKVLTERDDIFILKGGRRVSVPVMGVFHVNDANRITLWRDYFDLASWNLQMGLDPDFGRATSAR